MSALDAGILLLFAAYAITAGLRARRQASRNLEEYFLAGRSLSGTSAGVSMAATQFAADTPLLVTGLIATAGVFSLWRLWIYALAFLLLGFVLAPGWRRAGVLTDAAFAEFRYTSRPSAWLRGVKAVYFGTIFNCTVLAMVLFAAKEVAEPFLLWHAWLPEAVFAPVVDVVRAVGVPFASAAPSPLDVWVRSADNLISVVAIVGVTAMYSATGGLRSVVRTDVAQLVIMFAATAGYAAWVLSEAGGMDAVVAGIHARFADGGGPGGIRASEILAFTPGHAKDVTGVVLAVFALQWLVQMNADGTGYLAQRAMACRSDADARRAAVVFTVLQVLVRSLLWLPIGLGLLVLFPPDPSLGLDALRAEREASFVRGIQALPVGLRGLMLTAMVAALASTIDSHVNWGASYWTNDLYKRFWMQGVLRREPSPRSLVWIARLSSLVLLVIAFGIMTQLSSIQMAWQASLLLGAGMGVMLVLRWVWWRVNAWGELATVMASTALAPALLFGLPESSEAARLLWMALGATGAGIAVALATAPEPAAALDTFYRRVRPPGFWAPVARRSGADPAVDVERLGRGLGTTALAALSVFALLTGLGSWWIASPPPDWLPWRPAWVALLLVLVAAVVPVWWRWQRRLDPGPALPEPAGSGETAPPEDSGSGP